jgi:hypothetical protein
MSTIGLFTVPGISRVVMVSGQVNYRGAALPT